MEPTDDCADAIGDYLDSLTTGDAPAASSAAGAEVIGSYLDHLAKLQHAQVSGAGLMGHLDSLGGGASTAIDDSSAPAVKIFLDSLSRSAATAPATPSSPAPLVSPSAP